MLNNMLPILILYHTFYLPCCIDNSVMNSNDCQYKTLLLISFDIYLTNEP